MSDNFSSYNHFITHIEFSTKDLEETKNSYVDVFAWKITDFLEMNYATFEAESGSGGGFNLVSEDYPAGRILVYINTPNLKETQKKIKTAGGAVLQESYEVPCIGTMALSMTRLGTVWPSCNQSRSNLIYCRNKRLSF